MTVTLYAPVIGQSESASSDHAECGKLAALAAVQHWFPSVTTLPIPDNATAAQVSAGINTIAGMASRCVVFTQAALSAAIDAGHYALVGVNVNGYCVLETTVTGIRHWITTYSDAEPADLYNCWPAALQTGEVAECASSLMEMVIVAGPTSAIPPTGDDMDLTQAEAIATLCDILGRLSGLSCPVGTGPALGAAILAGDIATVTTLANSFTVVATPTPVIDISALTTAQLSALAAALKPHLEVTITTD